MKAKDLVGPYLPRSLMFPAYPSHLATPLSIVIRRQGKGACIGPTRSPLNHPQPTLIVLIATPSRLVLFVDLVSSEEINYLDISGVCPRGSWCACSSKLGGDQVGAHSGYFVACIKISLCPTVDTTDVSEFQTCRGRHALRQSSDGTVRGTSC